MLTDDGKHLYVSWDEYHQLIERLAIQVHESGWEFDQILCLARGGLRPGDVMSRVFDKPLAIMATSSYRAEAGTIQGRLDMAKYITMPKGELAGRVLLVDDLLVALGLPRREELMAREDHPGHDQRPHALDRDLANRPRVTMVSALPVGHPAQRVGVGAGCDPTVTPAVPGECEQPVQHP